MDCAHFLVLDLSEIRIDHGETRRAGLLHIAMLMVERGIEEAVSEVHEHSNLIKSCIKLCLRNTGDCWQAPLGGSQDVDSSAREHHVLKVHLILTLDKRLWLALYLDNVGVWTHRKRVLRKLAGNWLDPLERLSTSGGELLLDVGATDILINVV